MAESRRSGRQRKHIDYSKLGGDDEDDDDFRGCENGNKKQKSDKENRKCEKDATKGATKSSENKLEKSKKQTTVEEKQTKGENSTNKRRLSLDEKVFNRDLEMALKLSKKSDETNRQIEESASVDKWNGSPVDQDDAEKTNSKGDGEICKNDVEDDDKNDKGPNAEYRDDSDDFEEESGSSDSDSDFSEVDSSAGNKKDKNTQKKGPARKEKKSPVKTVKPCVKKETVKVISTARRKPASSSIANSPLTVNWVPKSTTPSCPGGPTQHAPAGIRLGLSRRAVVKPLHTLVKSSN